MKKKPLIILLILVGLILPLALVINYLKGGQMDKVTAERQKIYNQQEKLTNEILGIEKLLKGIETKLENQEEDAIQDIDMVITKKSIVKKIVIDLGIYRLAHKEFINMLNSLEELTKNGSPEPGVVLTKVRELRQFLKENRSQKK